MATSISEILQSILYILPTPIKVLLFVFLITVITGFIMPAFLNVFGYACVMDGNNLALYQVPMSNFPQKAVLDIGKFFQDTLNTADTYSLTGDPFPDGDKTLLRVPLDCMVTTTYNGSEVTGYSSACVDCTPSSFFWRWSNSICVSDATSNLDAIVQPIAGFCRQCAPPVPYYYNHSNCYGQDECFFTISDPSLVSEVGDNYGDYVYFENIKLMGGVKRATDSSEFVNVQCVAVNKPSMYFFSIEVFNQQMWILLMVSYALIAFALVWYKLWL